MSSFILSLTIICAISWTGFAITCLECQQENSDTCEGVSVECPNATECVVISELYHAYDNLYHSIKKGCNPGIPGMPCGTLLYVADFNKKKIRLSMQCCTGDDCNTGNYQMPPEQEEHNGKTCTSCFGDGMHECISDDTVKCLNKEDICLDFIGRLKDPGNNIKEHNFKGCISPKVCSLRFGALIGVREIQTDRFDCNEKQNL